MVSIFLQIVGNSLLIFSVISQKFSTMSENSGIMASDDSKRKRLVEKIKTKWQVLFGFIYVTIGLVISIPTLEEKISSYNIASNLFLNILTAIFLLFITLGICTLITFLSKKKIDGTINKRKDGEMWLE
ncbi:MAG: hypothetical protein K2H09_03765 [Treponemataceae bacterium]|nr:hypothetical protein [Treponemataceae bacterium]